MSCSREESTYYLMKLMGDIQVTALSNTRAQVSTITRDFCEKYGYDIHPIKQVLCFQGTGGFSILYLGYIKATVRIPPIKGHDKCVPMFILKSSSPYSLRAPIQFGTTVLVGLWPGSLWKAGSCQWHLATDLHEYYGHCQSSLHSWNGKWWHTHHWCPFSHY